MPPGCCSTAASLTLAFSYAAVNHARCVGHIYGIPVTTGYAVSDDAHLFIGSLEVARFVTQVVA